MSISDPSLSSKSITPTQPRISIFINQFAMVYGHVMFTLPLPVPNSILLISSFSANLGIQSTKLSPSKEYSKARGRQVKDLGDFALCFAKKR